MQLDYNKDMQHFFSLFASTYAYAHCKEGMGLNETRFTQKTTELN